MSNPISGDAQHAALEQFIHCVRNHRLSMSIELASAALIFYDWMLTSGDEVDWLWRPGRSVYARMLFVLARYPALTSGVVALIPLTITLRVIATYLSFITILSAELVLAMRTWAIWQNSRWILGVLIILAIICAGPALAVIETDMSTTILVPFGSTWSHTEQQCRLMRSAVDRAWVVPYSGIMVYEVVVIFLTLYKILRSYRVASIPTPKSKLLEVLWMDGIMYFVLMLLLGILNVILSLHVADSQIRVGFTQLQTMMHSVLSTRIVLHTGRVLREGDEAAKLPTNTRDANGIRIRPDPDGTVELERLINEDT